MRYIYERTRQTSETMACEGVKTMPETAHAYAHKLIQGDPFLTPILNCNYF